MCILPIERPQNVNYRMEYAYIEGVAYTMDSFCMCIKCKHSVPNTSFPKDEMECAKTGGICNALSVCDKFEEDC